MGQVLHGCATTRTPSELAARHGLNHKTVAKWRKRAFVNDAPIGPKTRTRQCCRLRKKRSSSPSASIHRCRWTTASMPCRRRAGELVSTILVPTFVL